jgi:hypothetical protein
MALGKALFHTVELGKQPLNTTIDLNQESLGWDSPDLDNKNQTELLDYLPKFLAWLNEPQFGVFYQLITPIFNGSLVKSLKADSRKGSIV